MKKGLNVTLLTVAIAVMAISAMGRAPVIGDIQSPIVGNENGATQATPFIYPDAFDIVAKATDDSTAAANVRWSYYYAGTEVYRINNVNRVTVSDAAINNPGAARINGTTLDPADVDANAATITIRNVKYAPITGTGATPSGTFPIDSVMVTLFASDGTTYSQKEVMFYTDNGGNDRLSAPPTGEWTPVVKQTAFPSGSGLTWSFSTLVGGVVSNTSGGTAICLDVPLTGMNYAQWDSSWGIFSVAKNTVYRIRARINGTQTQAQRSPFFDLVVGNYASGQGLNLFGGDMMIFDNEGGANAPMLKTATSGTTYNMYWAPACMLTDYFNNSTVWSTANANNRKMYMTFRVMDLNSIAALTADEDSGVLCLNDLQIDSIPYGSLSFTSAWASPATLSSANTQAIDVINSANVSFDTGKVKIAPLSQSASSVTYGMCNPGDGAMATFPAYTDDYPVTWEANTLYKVTWSISAIANQDNPLDVIWTGMDCPSNEFISNSYVTSQEFKAAMPRTGTPQDYVAFFYSHNVSATTHNEWKSLRPRLEWANSPVLTESNCSGSYYVHSYKVEKVTPQ